MAVRHLNTMSWSTISTWAATSSSGYTPPGSYTSMSTSFIPVYAETVAEWLRDLGVVNAKVRMTTTDDESGRPISLALIRVGGELLDWEIPADRTEAQRLFAEWWHAQYPPEPAPKHQRGMGL